MPKRFVVVMIVSFVWFSVVFIPASAWEPELAKAHYSDEEFFINVRLGYGNLIDQPIFIPFDNQILPTPELKVIMGGIERSGQRNVSFLTFHYNSTSHEWDELYTNKSYMIELGPNDRYGVEDITIAVDPNATKMMVLFVYRDIEVKFWFEPDPLYMEREQTELQVRLRGMIMVGVAIVVFIFSLVAGRRLQRRAIVVPELPVVTGIMFILGTVMFVSSLVLIRFAYSGFDLLIRGFLSYDWLLLYPTQFGVFTLWIAHRHMGDILLELQLDYSRFDPLERIVKPTVTEGTTEEEKPEHERSYRWTKDIAIYKCYKWKRRLCWVRKQNSWSGFIQRLLGHHEYIDKNYIQTIKPDSGYWVENDKRVFISAIKVNDKEGSFGFDTADLHWDDFLISGVAFLLFLLGVSGFLPGWPSLALMGLGVLIFIIGFITKKSVIKTKRIPSVLELDPNRFIEGEMILYKQLDLRRIQDQVVELQKKLINKEREVIDLGYDWIVMFLDTIEDLLRGKNLEEEKADVLPLKEEEEEKAKEDKQNATPKTRPSPS